jgi:hypothetical protein
MPPLPPKSIQLKRKIVAEDVDVLCKLGMASLDCLSFCRLLGVACGIRALSPVLAVSRKSWQISAALSSIRMELCSLLLVDVEGYISKQLAH